MTEWRCPNGHVLGRVRANGQGIRNLEMYRQALDPHADDIDGADVAALIEGLTDVRCSICGAMRTWAPDARSVRRALQRYRAEEIRHDTQAY